MVNKRKTNLMIKHLTPKNSVMAVERQAFEIPNNSGVKNYLAHKPEWDDQQVNLGQVRLGSSSPVWTDYKGSQILAFNKAQDNKIFFTAQLTHSYKEETDIEFHIHVTYPDSLPGSSRWKFTYSWANIGVDFPTETTINKNITSPQNQDLHILGEILEPMTATNKKISSVLLCSLTRVGTDLSDTYDNSIYLAAVDFHIQVNSMGSKEELVK